jgi:hypothetical protein
MAKVTLTFEDEEGAVSVRAHFDPEIELQAGGDCTHAQAVATRVLNLILLEDEATITKVGIND